MEHSLATFTKPHFRLDTLKLERNRNQEMESNSDFFKLNESKQSLNVS